MTTPVRTRRSTRLWATIAAVIVVLAAVAACSGGKDSDTTPSESQTEGRVDTDRYDQVLLECNILSPDQIAKAVGGTSAFSTFNGAICRWVVSGPVITNVTFNWFEWNNLNVEKDTAKRLGYETENIRISSQTAFTQRDPRRPAVCGVTARAPSRGIVTWWVEPRAAAAGGDACAAPIKLMELVLTGGQ